jgi:hypothetical protein
MDGFNTEIFKDLFSGKNKDPLTLFKAFIKIATPEIVDNMLEKIDVIKYGGDLMHITV